jgi:predicted  nucleic acid-binding Zn-ribbon protein
MKSFEKLKSPILPKTRQQSHDSRLAKLKPRSQIENNEKSIEGFSKFSEILAETQTDIFELFENKQKTDAKSKLWEIFTNLNNKIWLLVFKPGISEVSPQDSFEFKDLKSRINEANMLIQDLKYKLQTFQSIDPKKQQILETELKKSRKENKKMIEELSKMSKDYIFKENKISELNKLSMDLRNELNMVKNESGKEIALIKLKLEEVLKEKELLDDWKNQTDEDLMIVTRFTQEKLFSEKENEELIEKNSILEKNFKIIQENYQEVQEKFWEKCKAFDVLSGQFKELQMKESKEKIKEKHKKSASFGKGSNRATTPCPQPQVLKKNTKIPRFRLCHEKSVEVFPVFHLKDLLLQSETKAVLLQNQIDNISIEKSKLESLLVREEQAKSELLGTLNNLQLEILNLKSEISQKNLKNEEIEKICSEGKEKVKDLIFQIKETNDKNIFLIKENNALANELESTSKKFLNLEKNHEKCADSYENWKKLQQDYITKIEDLQNKNRIIVDKDSLSLQNELKYAKNLIIKKEAEIAKLSKEKDTQNQEFYENELKYAKALIIKKDAEIAKICRERENQEFLHFKSRSNQNSEEESEEKIKNLENHILNLKSLIEVKEKIIREYGINRPKLTENSCNLSQISKITSEKSIYENISDQKANSLVISLKTEKENLSNYVGQLECRLNDCEGKIAELRKEISSKEDEILVLTTNLSLEKSTVYFIQGESSKFKSKNNKLKLEIKELNKEIVKLRNKLESLNTFNSNEVSLKYLIVCLLKTIQLFIKSFM